MPSRRQTLSPPTPLSQSPPSHPQSLPPTPSSLSSLSLMPSLTPGDASSLGSDYASGSSKDWQPALSTSWQRLPSAAKQVMQLVHGVKERVHPLAAAEIEMGCIPPRRSSRQYRPDKNYPRPAQQQQHPYLNRGEVPTPLLLQLWGGSAPTRGKPEHVLKC